MLNDDWGGLWNALRMGRRFRRHFGMRGPGWSRLGPGVWAGGWSRMRRGDMKYWILEVLAERPRHGYDVIRDLEARHEGYRPSPGSIYPTLQLLEDGGFVTSETVDGKRVYTIADAGRKMLEERGPDFEGESDDEGERPAWFDLRDTVVKLGAAVWQVARDSDPATVARVREILDRARREIYQILASDTQQH